MLSSILIFLCHTEVYIWLPSHISENLIPEADLCSDWFLLLTNCCGSDSVTCCQFSMYYLAPVPYWGRLDGLCWKPSRVSCWRRLGFVLKQELLNHPPCWVYGTSLLASRYILFQNHPQRRIIPYIWTIPLTDNIMLVLYPILSACWFDHHCYEECILR